MACAVGMPTIKAHISLKLKAASAVCSFVLVSYPLNFPLHIKVKTIKFHFLT